MPAGDPPLTFADLHALSVERLKGVGPQTTKNLAKAGITSVFDLLTHYPRRYLDRTREATIDSLPVGEEGMVFVTVQKVSSRRTRNRRTMVEATVSDGESRMGLTFFNQPWRERQLEIGAEAVVFGKLESFRGKLQMTNPVVDLVAGGGQKATGRILPVYPQSEKAGLMTWDLARFVEDALVKCRPRGFADPVPPKVLEQLDLIDRSSAIAQIHAPQTMGEVSSARKRLVFDELLRIQVKLVQRKRMLEATEVGVHHDLDGALVPAFQDRLGFPLTGAQRRAIDEIEADLAATAPMHRLLQGDVGAGKTVVAVSALLTGVQGGHQGALMAPTEVLAEQHYLGIAALLDGMEVPDTGQTLLNARPLTVELLANRTPAADRKRILVGLADGTVDLVIGTHALIQDAVEFSSLGVVVIDEQHRFGVEQRSALRDKNVDGHQPDVLVMTATPIPRTAAMTVYGDLDVSVLDELPPGRTPIETRWEPDDGVVWRQVRHAVDEGRQAYVVCPLIEESEALDVASAESTHDELAHGVLHDLRVGLLHGRMSSADKEATMTRFRDGDLDVLVATTVIEVGVDVPNATVMVIMDAARFGIAQLHQLRGRVGRGEHASQCYLLGEATTADGEARLEALVASTDGFELAEVDLELRGEGTIMGERQKGRNDLKLASLRRDKAWVEIAREVAYGLVDPDPSMAEYPELAAEIDFLLGEDQADYLLKS
ncbi:MAG: ATP-dependent DNA helicase RecG [Acidimicrobiales bacterium]|nr:ATP-dependent DNA helicase RecG [Acidimicrobiales bacterium]